MLLMLKFAMAGLVLGMSKGTRMMLLTRCPK
jgi:hypothetical protein